MKQELLDNELEKVAGGSVIISDRGIVGFDTFREMYQLNVPWYDARNFAESLRAQHLEMGNEEFDRFCMGEMAAAGMLGPQL